MAQGTLYLVATPIGNLEDITHRAVRVLQEVSLIAAEDTRRTKTLLARYEIRTPMVSYQAYSEERRLEPLLLRLKGAYFALLTLAFNSLFYAVATKWHSVTGGDDGLSIKRPVVHLGFTLLRINTVTAFYYLTFLIIGFVILFCWYFTHTAMGQTIILMRENEDRMKFLGYDTSLSRLILFTFTGAIAGLAGAFYTLHFQFVSISAISLDMATAVLLITFVGGTGTFWGPIIGSFVYIILQNYLSDLTDRWPLFMGFIFILMVLFIPGGLSKLILTAKAYLFGKREESEAMEGENS